MDTNILAHVHGLTKDSAEATKMAMNWDEDDGEVSWPAYVFLALMVLGIVWYIYDWRTTAP